MDTNLTETELEALEVERADRSIFLQDLLLNTLMMNLNDEEDEKAALLVCANTSTESHQSFSSSSRECADIESPPQLPPQQQLSNQSSTPSSVALASTATTAMLTERPRSEITNGTGSCSGSGNAVNAETPSASVRRSSGLPQHLQPRTSPITERTTTSTNTANNQRTVVPPSRGSGTGGNGSSIEYLLAARSPQPSTDSNSISVRGVLMGPSSYSSADTARRKPMCTVDSVNQATEPPTSH